MRFGFQMDHPSRLNAATDTTFMLIEEAQKRGIECVYFAPQHVSLRQREVVAMTQGITVDTKRSPVWELSEPTLESLHALDGVFMRQDPPFDMNYITGTYLLEMLLPDTRVVNHPTAVRNMPEKLSSLRWAEFMPPTLVSGDAALIRSFVSEQQEVVAKPLHGYGGRAIFKLSADDPNLETIIEHWREVEREPLMWQKFLPEVTARDTRVILINGDYAGHFTREPQGTSIRANMRVGGIPKRGELSAKQQSIITALKSELRAQELLLVGLDLIGDYLTEINVTSPTGLRAYQALTGENLAASVLNALSV
jgi:glutathione synthase